MSPLDQPVLTLASVTRSAAMGRRLDLTAVGRGINLENTLLALSLIQSR
jgi:hypothetical protein